jgi:DNA-binding CsgD family transcriptional regulator
MRAVACLLRWRWREWGECEVAQRDDLMLAITEIYAAGLDPQKWPEALRHVTSLVGGVGTTLEILAVPSLQLRAIYAYGLSGVGPYREHFAKLNVRLPHAIRQPSGAVLYDGQFYGDADIDADPFYMEFLRPYELRYFVGGVIAKSPEEWIGTGVQLSPKQGHPTPAKMKLMQALLPHMQQAVDVMQRLGKASDANVAFERTLDWLAAGVVLVGADGAVCYANMAAQKIFRANDGVSNRRGILTLESADATAKLGTAVKAVVRLRDHATERMQADFMAPRRESGLSYVISVRPLIANAGANKVSDAVALVFIHDPSVRGAGGAQVLAQVFGLTSAEADVANALCLGLSPGEYARRTKTSANTVYTHIRHLKDKTGSRRMAELIRKLNAAQVRIAR